MKVKCNYCGSMINDTLERCPNCGAPNENVKRTTKSQPQTIEQLATWYRDRGLPPYETTRFFIGENYTKPKAFGIYKDDHGKCVVYKNKANGERAIRYEGTDEAYAVNELFQRLKEEILEQKAARIQPSPSSKNNKVGDKRRSAANQAKSVSHINRTYTPPKKNTGLFGAWETFMDKTGCFGGCLTLIVAGILLLSAFLGVGALVIKVVDSPALGYYEYNGQYMYFSDWTDGISDNGWIEYDEDNDSWSGVFDRKYYPKELQKNKTAQKYFLAEEWHEGIGCPNFLKSKDYVTISGNDQVEQGYFHYNDTDYYHQGTGSSLGWYEYDTDSDSWQPTESEDVPEDLTQYWQAHDFYYTPEWNSDTQISDFTDSEYYVPPASSSNNDNDSSSWWDNDYDDSSYDWDSDWDWDSDSDSYDWDSDW